ncbi:unnamed protein product [Schistosoma turkestanicum]|nr:unnamed protein product [Schistosoma turkestanicum]
MDIKNSTKKNQPNDRLCQMSKSTKRLTHLKSDEYYRQIICERSLYQLKPLPGKEFNYKLAKIIIEQVLHQLLLNYNDDTKSKQMNSKQPLHINAFLCNLTNQLHRTLIHQLKAFDTKNGGRYKLIVYTIQTNSPKEEEEYQSSSSSTTSIMVASCGLYNRETDYYLSETKRTSFGQLIVIVYACYHE